MTRTSPLLFVTLLGLAVSPAHASGPRALVEDGAGPGLSHSQRVEAFAMPAFTFSEAEVFTEISAIRGEDAPDFHGTAFWYGGAMGVVHAKGMLLGGVSMWDLSDPYEPTLVGHGKHPAQREGHATGFMETSDGWRALMPAANGVNLWDLEDISRPKVTKNVRLPGVIPSDYDFGAWWVAAQSPWIYVAGAFNGLYVIDASNPRRPKVVNQLRVGDGFRCGALFTVGNLLVQSSSEGNRTRLYDISDPANPQLIKEVEQENSSYATYFNGGYLYAAADRGGLEIIDLNDVDAPTTLSYLPQSGGGAYVVYQDDHAFLGNSNAFYKLNVSDPYNQSVVGSAGIEFASDVDNDFVSPLGNIAVVSDDHVLTQFNAGSRLIPHQAAPDTRAPEPNFVSPAPGSTQLNPTSRIGFTFTDQILVESVGPESFIVRTTDGQLVDGLYSVQEGIVNFAPLPNLPELAEIEVILPAGGIADVAGNTLATEWRGTFTTGQLIVNPPIADAGADAVGAPGDTVALSASGTRGGVGNVLFSWDAGDGSAPSEPSTNPAFTHRYDSEGHYTAIVTAVDDRGQTSTDEATVTVVRGPQTPRPTGSSPLAYDASTDTVWVVNPDGTSVGVVDSRRLSFSREVAVGHHPRTLAVSPDSTVWVAVQDDARVVVIDTLSARIIRTLELAPGSRPYGIALSPDLGTVYVTLEGTGQLVALNAATGAPRWAADVGPNPRGIACAGDRVYVTRFISPATHGEVITVGAASGAVLNTITLMEDPGPDSDIGGRGVPNYLSQIVPNPSGTRLFIPGMKQNTSRGPTRDGLGLTFESTNRAMLSIIDVAAGEEDMAARVDFDNRDQASALALSPLGDFAFVALQGSQDVIAIDAFNGQQRGVIEHVGHAPQGLLITPDSRLWVANFMGRNVSVYDVASLGGDDGLAPLGAARTVADETLTGEVLLGKRIFYNASDTRMSRDSYISCAGCHLDGGADQRVWDFTDRGEGLRRTISLRGRGGTLHGPVHWSANFDEIQDFENDIRGAFDGTGFLSEADWSSGTHATTLGDAKTGLSPELDAMAAYVATLVEADPSPYRAADGSLTAAAARGQSLFEDPAVGCADCHAGPHFTDSTLTADRDDFILHDVGTLTDLSGGRLGGPLPGLDTPTLKGVWNGGPYLHDGSAPTLEAVLIDRNPSDLHGTVSPLSPSERSDLLAYVRSIDARSGAPVMTQTSPPEGATWAQVDAVHIQLSSWPDAATLAGGVTLRRGSQTVAGSLTVDRGLVTFTPATRLVAGSYTVAITSGLSSVDGDPAVPATSTFTIADVPVVTDLVVYSANSGDYSVEDTIRKGSLMWGDREDRVLKLPAAYEGLTYLRTSNADRRESRPALVSMVLTAPGTIYAAFDRRHDRLPGWAADFTPTGDTLVTTDFSSSPMDIYVGHFKAGEVIFGGVRADGGTGNNANFILMFKRD